MLDIKHTPGPWNTGRNPDSTTTIYCKTGYGLADCYGKESRENGKLIAAAPEMLAALINCEEFLSVQLPNCAQLIQVREALRKAEGKS